MESRFQVNSGAMSERVGSVAAGMATLCPPASVLRLCRESRPADRWRGRTPRRLRRPCLRDARWPAWTPGSWGPAAPCPLHPRGGRPPGCGAAYRLWPSGHSAQGLCQSFAHDLDDQVLAAAAVEFGVVDPLPRPEVELSSVTGSGTRCGIFTRLSLRGPSRGCGSRWS